MAGLRDFSVRERKRSSENSTEAKNNPQRRINYGWGSKLKIAEKGFQELEPEAHLWPKTYSSITREGDAERGVDRSRANREVSACPGVTRRRGHQGTTNETFDQP